MDRWDVILMVIAGFVAISALVRLMAHRRSQLIEQVRKQLGKSETNPEPPAEE